MEHSTGRYIIIDYNFISWWDIHKLFLTFCYYQQCCTFVITNVPLSSYTHMYKTLHMAGSGTVSHKAALFHIYFIAKSFSEMSALLSLSSLPIWELSFLSILSTTLLRLLIWANMRVKWYLVIVKFSFFWLLEALFPCLWTMGFSDCELPVHWSYTLFFLLVFCFVFLCSHAF